jgi:hypothetical protein
MVDSSFKKPLNESLADTANAHANNFQQVSSKGLPCHVTKVSKDMVTVMFETNNGVWSMPTREMPQAFSAYAREPTKVGDKGYASPADYYLGGVTGLGGGKTNFAPKGNLTPLVFHPISNTGTEKRDYDQYTLTGGKTGVKIVQGESSKTSNDPRLPPPPSVRRVRGLSTAARKRWQFGRVGLFQGKADSSSGDTTDKRATMLIDKDGVITHTGKLDGDSNKPHQMLIDSSKQKIALNVPVQGSIVYLGGPGKKPEYYSPVITGGGASINVWAKYVMKDEDDDGG